MKLNVFQCDWCGKRVDDLQQDWIVINAREKNLVRIEIKNAGKQKVFRHLRAEFHFCCPECLLNFITSDQECV